MAVTTEKDALRKDREMGRKHIVPYALYRVEGFISAGLANKQQEFLSSSDVFSAEDLELLWNALINMFDHDRSAARGKMATRKLIVFKHDSILGNAPAYKLFDLVQVQKLDPSRPPRAYSDYQISIDKAGVPAGVELIEML